MRVKKIIIIMSTIFLVFVILFVGVDIYRSRYSTTFSSFNESVWQSKNPKIEIQVDGEGNVTGTGCIIYDSEEESPIEVSFGIHDVRTVTLRTSGIDGEIISGTLKYNSLKKRFDLHVEYDSSYTQQYKGKDIYFENVA